MDQQPPQEPYQQPPYQQPYRPAPPGGVWGMSSIGNIGAHIVAGLAYLIAIVPFIGFVLQIILFAVEKNRFARFHAAQAMILSIAGYALSFVSFIVSSFFGAGANVNSAIVSFLSGSIGALFGCVFGIIGIALFAFWIWGMIAGFTGKPTKLPVIGDIAEGLSGGRLPV